jgi:hypothetical protein
MRESEAVNLAQEWVAAWNSHDLERIMSHYSEDAELSSPLMEDIVGAGWQTVRGKDDLRAYFRRGLDAFPDLKFKLLGVYAGVQSVVVHYRSVRGMDSAEFMSLDADGHVSRVVAHYAQAVNRQ